MKNKNNKYKVTALGFTLALLASASLEEFAIAGGITSGNETETYTMQSAMGMQQVELQPNKQLALNPLIVKDADGKISGVSQQLKDLQSDLLMMNDMSYKLIASDKYLEQQVAEMERLKKAGYSVFRGFYGLEGTESTAGDMSGFVAYNPQKNVMTVVYRGTATSEGWETNVDGSKVWASEMVDMFTEEFYPLLKKELEKASSLKLSQGSVDTLKTLSKSINQLGKKQRSAENLVKFKEQIEDVLNAETDQNTVKFLTDLKAKITGRVNLIEDAKRYSNDDLFKGQVHRGFMKKVITTMPYIVGIMKDITRKFSPEQMAKLKIMFTGHSQGGGTGNVAMMLFTAVHGTEIFGSDFNNRKTNNVSGYFLSGARAFDESAAEQVHHVVGRRNIIRQNVDGDLVPIASADETVTNVLKESATILKPLLNEMAGYGDTGWLLLDDAHETWARAKKVYQQEGIKVSKYDEVDSALRTVLGSTIGAENIPENLLPYQPNAHIVWSPIKWFGRFVNMAKVGFKTWWNRKAMINTVVERFAPYHYGLMNEYVDEKGERVKDANFDPRVVGTNLDKLLQNGTQHYEKKNKVN